MMVRAREIVICALRTNLKRIYKESGRFENKSTSRDRRDYNVFKIRQNTTSAGDQRKFTVTQKNSKKTLKEQNNDNHFMYMDSIIIIRKIMKINLDTNNKIIQSGYYMEFGIENVRC